MSIVTLTTDFGTKDYFVSATKAALLSELNNINIFEETLEENSIVDLSSFVLKDKLREF